MSKVGSFYYLQKEKFLEIRNVLITIKMQFIGITWQNNIHGCPVREEKTKKIAGRSKRIINFVIRGLDAKQSAVKRFTNQPAQW